MAKKVIVASTNPVKIKAAKLGFKKMFPNGEFSFEGVSVDSGVKDQPDSDEETLRGAAQRVEYALNLRPKADYWIAFEGGIEDKKDGMEVFAWVVIKSKKSKVGKSKTGTFFLPPGVAKLINDGMELGLADDKFFKRSNSKHTNGSVGILTDDVIDRTKYYVEAVVLALIPFKNPKLY